jgi:hypothetical protein
MASKSQTSRQGRRTYHEWLTARTSG